MISNQVQRRGDEGALFIPSQKKWGKAELGPCISTVTSLRSPFRLAAVAAVTRCDQNFLS
jgi:hypothetical protein